MLLINNTLLPLPSHTLAMASSSQALPSQEQVLQLIESNGGTIQDTRTLWKGPTEKPSWEDVTASEEYFNRRAAWQVSLTGILNSLRSRDVSKKFIKKESCVQYG